MVVRTRLTAKVKTELYNKYLSTQNKVLVYPKYSLRYRPPDEVFPLLWFIQD